MFLSADLKQVIRLKFWKNKSQNVTSFDPHSLLKFVEGIRVVSMFICNMPHERVRFGKYKAAKTRSG